MDSRKEKDKSSQLTMWELMKVNLQLGASKALLVLPTQPLQTTMRMQQKELVAKDKPRVMSARQILHEIAPDARRALTQPFQVMREMHQAGTQAVPATPATYITAAFRSHPLHNVYKGLVPGMFKEGLKSGAYKGAVIVKAPDMANSLLSYTPLSPLQFPQVHALAGVTLAGGIAGLADTVFGGALDSFATHAATAQGKDANASYLQELRTEKNIFNVVKRAYRGFYPALGKSSLAFSMMYGTKEPIEHLVAKCYGLEKHHRPWYATLTTATVSGFTVAVTTSWLDQLKTWRQMPNPNNLPMHEVMSKMYQDFGVRGMMTGVPLKTVMVMMGWGLTFAITQNRHHTPKATHHGDEHQNTVTNTTRPR